jgi:hypothetical protein
MHSANAPYSNPSFSGSCHCSEVAMILRNFTCASLFGLHKNRAHAVACVADPADHFSGSFRFVRGDALLIAAAGKEEVLSVPGHAP